MNSDPNFLSDLGGATPWGAALGAVGSALGGLGGGPSAASGSSSTPVSTPFYAPSNFNVGGGSASSSGDIGSTSQSPSSSASAAASQSLPPTAALAGQPSALTSNFLWPVLAAVAAAGILAFLHFRR